ncbi:phosphatidylglycerophosphatase A [Pelagibacteraceae bacterium]|nr:phosphatidylglycerophosphatase A [Pelagibacteraceae bacterium]
MKSLSKFVVTISYIGLFPIASGTFASIATVIIWILFIKSDLLIYFAIISVLLFIISFHFIDIYLSDIADKDPKEVVIDEFVGQSIPLLIVPSSDEITIIFLIFIFFRFFDIFKIYPINLLEKIKGSKGVMFDDIMAGIYTAIVVLFINSYIL